MTIDLSTIHDGQARLDKLDKYIQQALDLVGNGDVVTLTGSAPIWMYLAIACALYGKARILRYSSPVTGEVTIYPSWKLC
jgi:hypothetical protein